MSEIKITKETQGYYNRLLEIERDPNYIAMETTRKLCIQKLKEAAGEYEEGKTLLTSNGKKKIATWRVKSAPRPVIDVDMLTLKRPDICAEYMTMTKEVHELKFEKRS